MRGFWYMLESVICGVIIIMFMVAITNSFAQAGTDDISSVAYMKLQDLDNFGVLRSLAAVDDCEGISDSISIPGYKHSVQVCDSSGICSCERPFGNDIHAAERIVSGDLSFDPKTVKLFVWREQ